MTCSTREATQEDTANQFEVHIGDYNGDYPGNPACTWTPDRQRQQHASPAAWSANVYPLVRGMYNKREDKIDAVGLEQRVQRRIDARLVADLSWSKAKRDELSLENNTQLLPAQQLDTLTLDLQPSGFSTDQSGPRLLRSRPSCSSTNTIYGSGYGKTPSVVDELKSSKLAANLPASERRRQLFASYRLRPQLRRPREGKAPARRQHHRLARRVDTTIAPDLQYGLVDLGFAGVGFIPSWNVPGAVARYMTFDPNEDASYLVAKAWTVDEKITTGFLKANIDTAWGSVPVRGNIGVQVQHVDQSSTANVLGQYAAGRAADRASVRDGKTYTDCAAQHEPRVLAARDDQMLRFALARQVARPRVDQLRASLEFGVDTATGKPGASGGNPLLDPWRANAFDISYEKYFGTKAYVAAAYFYKDLTHLHLHADERRLRLLRFVAAIRAAGRARRRRMTPAHFTAPLQWLGRQAAGPGADRVAAAGTVLRSRWTASASSPTPASTTAASPSAIRTAQSSVGSGDISLPGLSDRVYNFTAYYEHNGFESAHQPASSAPTSSARSAISPATARCATSSARTSPTRRSATPSAMARLQGPDAAAPGAQPDQRALPAPTPAPRIVRSRTSSGAAPTCWASATSSDCHDALASPCRPSRVGGGFFARIAIGQFSRAALKGSCTEHWDSVFPL